MRILMITQFYPPERGAAQTRLSALAQLLTAAGDDVEVLTGLPNYPTGVIPRPYRGKFFLREVRDGIRVNRAWLYPAPNRGRARRILNHASFAVTSILASFACRRPDIILVESPPLLLGISGWIIGGLRGAPFIFNVADLATEAATALGVLRGRVVIRFAERLESFIYGRASGIIALTGGVERGIIQRGASPAKVRQIRGGVDLGRFDGADGTSWRERHGLNDRFIALYAGTHGDSQGLPTVIQAAREILDEPRIQIVFVGDGAAKAELQRMAAELTNTLFLPSEPPEAMPSVLAAADACLVPQPNRPVFGGVLPAKMFEAMAAGRAVVLAAPRGEASTIVESAECGVAVPAEEPQALAAALRRLASDDVGVRRMGHAGRRFAERELSRGASASQIRMFLQESSYGLHPLAVPVDVDDLEIRTMRSEDIERVVEIHVSAFPGFFLSYLGPSFLRLLYAEAVRLGEIALVATSRGRIVGFAMGSAQPDRFFETLLRRRSLAFAVAALPAIARRPQTLPRVARALVKAREAKRPPGKTTFLSMGVHPGGQGKGIGRLLVERFLEAAAQRGAKNVDLTTDKFDNDRTNAFYHRLGFRVAGEIVTPERRVLYEYEIDIAPSAANVVN